MTDYIKSLNWIHRVSLRNAKIDYYNMEGSFIDVHTVKMKSAGGAERQITSKWFLLSVGGRPTLPDDVPGAKEYAITSDDIFHMQNAPGKTFVVGGSYVALECAGFLTGLGYETQVCQRLFYGTPTKKLFNSIVVVVIKCNVSLKLCDI